MTMMAWMWSAVVTLALMCGGAAAEGSAKGTAGYTSKKGPITVTFTHAALVSGPDPVDGKPMRRLILSTQDVSAALAKCDSMRACSDAGIVEGMTVDFRGDPRLGYWFVANGQLVQYSGMITPADAVLTTDSPKRLAGTLTFDQAASGGPAVSVTFDAPLVKALAK